jgi:hypothetical protein
MSRDGPDFMLSEKIQCTLSSQNGVPLAWHEKKHDHVLMMIMMGEDQFGHPTTTTEYIVRAAVGLYVAICHGAAAECFCDLVAAWQRFYICEWVGQCGRKKLLCYLVD